ncbi:MAG: argininosuccinate lyase [Deltaproteobacteria bacterium]
MKLWGGRFSRAKRDELFERFSESFSVDQRLIAYDLRVNAAYVRELGRARVLAAGDVKKLMRGLASIGRYVETHPRWASGAAAEDVHSWVESQLEKSIGPLAGKLRTGRSRNDLVATETRMFTKDAVARLQASLLALMDALAAQAREHSRAVLPGFTHLQPAQPILFAHYLLAYFEMFLRDYGRLEDCHGRADVLPMGAGALAGSSFPINRARLARDLGFSRASANSLDVTSDRDFVCELIFVCSLTQVHLSRLAEDLVIYSSPAFGFIELADTYSTGSSLMPQKKNPDSLELIRGKAARTLGKLTGSLAMVKGLPLAYNRDLQEDKAALFDAVDTARDSLEIAARVIRTMKINPQRMRAGTAQGFLTATDLAEELVRRGVPFSAAHEQVGKLVRACVEKGITLDEISDADARRVLAAWDPALRRIATSPERALAQKNVVGGTAPGQVTRQIRSVQQTLAKLKSAEKR